jgi:hypothetical protein
MMKPMSSSISTSERDLAGADARGWWRFARIFAATVVTLWAALGAVLYLIDPFDTGRSPLPLKAGMPARAFQSPETARLDNASRGRDQAFSGAIIGNSHVQALDPKRLTAATGIPFVALVAQASGPLEQLALLDWFVRHRTKPAALVLGIDGPWCTARAALTNDKPFPFWLYSRWHLAYLAGLMRFSVVTHALPERIAYLLGLRERARPDGYWDYEPRFAKLGSDGEEQRRKLELPQETAEINRTGLFRAAEALAERLARLPRSTRVVLLRPPVFVTGLSAPGSEAATADQACLAAFSALATRRPNTFLLDWRIDRSEIRDASGFIDHTHYRKNIARLVEADIARLIGDGPMPAGNVTSNVD